jgi:hypothetical protein
VILPSIQKKKGYSQKKAKSEMILAETPRKKLVDGT